MMEYPINAYQTYKQSVSTTSHGHIRSASLENAHSFILKNTLGLPIISPITTGTLKSRNEQKRLKNRFENNSNLENYIAQSKSKFQNLRKMFEPKLDYEHQSQLQSPNHRLSPRHHLSLNIKLNPPQSLTPHQSQQQQYLSQQTVEFNESLSIIEADKIGADNNKASNNKLNHHNHLPNTNMREENFDQDNNLLRPIAFKPIPFEPDYSIPNRYGDLCDRYGSTPSLAPIQGSYMKFGSTSDLRHGYNSYGSNLIARRRCSRSLKIDDSMESIRHTPDIDSNCQNSTIKYSNKFLQDQFDVTPSPSDSGISELEAALKDRDSELSYLRQTMEHNEKVIFKVYKDKEAYWEQEIKRLKIFYESQKKEYLLKIKKIEQMLTLQSFQFKQNKLKLSENSDLKNENQLLRSETEGLKTTGRTMRDRVNQLGEKINVMDKLILNLKTQLEENEWTLCQKNGEIALLKTQLKEATVELTLKDQEIVFIKTEHQSNKRIQKDNINESMLENNPNLEVSQLNRIIILKDQVILALTSEVGKLRKELSDLAIVHEYGEEPPGKYSRLKYKIDNLTGICNTTIRTTSNSISDNNMREEDQINYNNIENVIKENDLELILNCLKSETLIDRNDQNTSKSVNDLQNLEILNQQLISANMGLLNQTNLPDVTKNSTDTVDDINICFNEHASEKSSKQNDLLKKELFEAKRTFNIEKLRWGEEKEKVLIYQRQLQLDYINMYQKMKELEKQVSFQKINI